MTDYDRQDITGMPLCKQYKQCMASMCYFQNLQYVIQDAVLCCLVWSVVDHIVLIASLWLLSDVQVCHQRLSIAFDLLLIFLCSLIQTITLTPTPNNALLANIDCSHDVLELLSCYTLFCHGGNCLWFMLFCISVVFLLFFHFLVYSHVEYTCSIHVRKVNIIFPTRSILLSSDSPISELSLAV